MTNHLEKAKDAIANSEAEPYSGVAKVHALQAQAHATIALVEILKSITGPDGGSVKVKQKGA